MRELRNECGSFWVDDAGVLQRFDCDYYNKANRYSFASFDSNPRVLNLHIPEGVTALPEYAFRFYDVLWDFSLPDSLEVLGTGPLAFQRARLPEVRLPKSLKVLGDAAFHSCCIHDLYLPEEMPWPYARHFKEASIGVLHISRRYQDGAAATKLGEGVWRSLQINDVRIGRYAWED